ncbi:MAG: energy transducer TonB [Acidobacteriota bacterium]
MERDRPARDVPRPPAEALLALEDALPPRSPLAARPSLPEHDVVPPPTAARPSSAALEEATADLDVHPVDLKLLDPPREKRVAWPAVAATLALNGALVLGIQSERSDVPAPPARTVRIVFAPPPPPPAPPLKGDTEAATTRRPAPPRAPEAPRVARALPSPRPVPRTEPARLSPTVDAAELVQASLPTHGDDAGAEDGVEGGASLGVDGGVVGAALGTHAPDPAEARVMELSSLRLLSRVDPVYPPIARRSGVEGTVVLEATIEENGDVSMVRVLRSIPVLDASAIAAVKGWKFAPPRAGEVATRARVTVELSFSLVA